MMEWLTLAMQKINAVDLTFASLVVAGALDVIVRVWKTEKPRSVLYLIADGFKGVGKLLELIGMKMDVVLQRTKAPAVQAETPDPTVNPAPTESK